MIRLQEAIGLGLILGAVHGLVQPAYSVPVVPNFTQGSMTSSTETKSKVVETINSMDYNTGFNILLQEVELQHQVIFHLELEQIQ